MNSAIKAFVKNLRIKMALERSKNMMKARWQEPFFADPQIINGCSLLIREVKEKTQKKCK